MLKVTFPYLIKSIPRLGGAATIELSDISFFYNDGTNTRSALYSEIVALRHGLASKPAVYTTNVVPQMGDVLSVVLRGGTEIHINQVIFDLRDLGFAVQIITEMNPDIILDEDVVSLKRGNSAPFKKSTKLIVLFLLLLGLSLFTLSLFVTTPMYRPLLSLGNIDMPAIVILGSLGIFFFLIVFEMFEVVVKKTI